MKAIALCLTAVAIFSFSSCSNCTSCSKGTASEQVCEGNFSSTSAYEAEVTALEVAGYTCTAP